MPKIALKPGAPYRGGLKGLSFFGCGVSGSTPSPKSVGDTRRTVRRSLSSERGEEPRAQGLAR